MQDIAVPFQKGLLDSEIYSISAEYCQLLRHELQIVSVSVPNSYTIFLLSRVKVLKHLAQS